MKGSYSPSREFVAAMITIGVVVVTTLWIWWAIKQSTTEPRVRAVSSASHQACEDMPRGNQEMENGRINCFNKLYAIGRYQAGL